VGLFWLWCWGGGVFFFAGLVSLASSPYSSELRHLEFFFVFLGFWSHMPG